jgi:hypothetical protein
MDQASSILLVDDAFISQELHDQAAKIGLSVASLDGLIESMNEQGLLLMRGGRKYKVRCTSKIYVTLGFQIVLIPPAATRSATNRSHEISH